MCNLVEAHSKVMITYFVLAHKTQKPLGKTQ